MSSSPDGSTTSQIDTSFLDLPGVFQTLANNQRTGVLKVSSNGRMRGVRFESGSVRMVIEPERADFLVDALIRSGQLDPVAANALALDPTKSAAQQLLDLGLLDEAQVDVAVNFHVMESACELFAWEDITCEFSHGEPGDPWVGPDLDRDVGLNPNALVMEACRRLDEGAAIAEVLPSHADVPALNFDPVLDPEELTSAAAEGDEEAQYQLEARHAVVALVDGQRDVQEILDVVPLSRFDARLVLADLVREESARLLDREELLAIARELMKRDSVGSAEHKTRRLIRVYERIEELGYENPQLTIWLGRAYEMAGRSEDAIGRYIGVSGPLMDQGRSKEAVEILARAINLAPGNAELRRLLVDAYLKDRDNEQAAEIATGILADLRASEQPQEALALARAMREADPENAKVLQHLGELLLEHDDRTSAILEFEELANLQLIQGRSEQAVQTFEKILELDYYHLMAHFRLAETLHKVGQTDEAVRRYKQLADMLQDTAMGDSINWQFLIRTYENIAEIEVDNVLAKEWLARTYLEQGKTAEAQRHLQSIVAVLRGEIAHDSLKAALVKLVELRPSDMGTRKLLAQCAHARDEPDLAVEQYLTLAELSLTLDKIPQARKALQTAAELRPLHLGVHQAFAELYTEEGKSREAAIKLRDVGYLKRAAGDLAAAEASFRQAIAVEPTERLCLLELATSYRDAGQPQEASRLYREVAEWAAKKGEYGHAWLACRAAGALTDADVSWVQPLQEQLFSASR